MADYLNTDTWARREAFEYFRRFDKPYFNVCVRLDAAPLKAAAAARGASFTLACHFMTLRLANLHAPLRYRLEGGRVRIFDAVHGSTTVLRDDESFGFAYLQHTADFAAFCTRGQAAMAAAHARHQAFEPRVDETALVHFTTLPWLHFTSFSHARNWGREDSVPKIAFGRLQAEGERLWLPFSVEVHHALMDGLHLGRYVQAVEAALLQPGPWLDGPAGA
ncbi:MAG: CatA-like O-acetyltransferase [Rubrivivax sp.]|nr:CatA-like O-acetyltransferase [Rubrivivax sp.]